MKTLKRLFQFFKRSSVSLISKKKLLQRGQDSDGSSDIWQLAGQKKFDVGIKSHDTPTYSGSFKRETGFSIKQRQWGIIYYCCQASLYLFPSTFRQDDDSHLTTELWHSFIIVTVIDVRCDCNVDARYERINVIIITLIVTIVGYRQWKTWIRCEIRLLPKSRYGVGCMQCLCACVQRL